MRLLLAEDEKELSNALVKIFKLNNYSVDAVYNGQDAIDYLNAENYDGVILDIMMPIVDGITVLKTIRKNNNNVPVLLLTARSEINDKVLGLDNGADDYLAKPFASKELLARIRAMTRRKTELTSSVLKFGNISLNRANYELSSEKDKFILANKEFQIMELLMTSSDILITSEVFMERIWGYDSESEINVVWAYLSYLRKKLKSLDANVEIKAHRNAGYKLEFKND